MMERLGALQMTSYYFRTEVKTAVARKPATAHTTALNADARFRQARGLKRLAMTASGTKPRRRYFGPRPINSVVTDRKLFNANFFAPSQPTRPWQRLPQDPSHQLRLTQWLSKYLPVQTTR
jgi:hypothetical protein